jgi:crotonobetainyl-CoA:carnitine CoA-transferase CaiB-like acyl-CoA transferase
MPGPLAGVKVIDMGVWVAGPSSAGILADWGADVIKIEPPAGDPFRGLIVPGSAVAPPFELDNRGKRSIALNLDEPGGLDIARRLIDGADIFVSNMRPRALAKYGLSYEECAARNPRLIYAEVSAYGPETIDANRASYPRGGSALTRKSPRATGRRTSSAARRDG